MTNIKYCACTVSVRDGKTYWNEPKNSYAELSHHLKRYVKRDCHVIVYTLKGDEDMVFLQHISNYGKDNEEVINA
tara:strand:+ start:423 stop:647 length:225 start_codon:yes stop_codon:yes gene_type:complete